MSLPRGNVSDTSRRLCSRAPRITMSDAAIPGYPSAWRIDVDQSRPNGYYTRVAIRCPVDIGGIEEFDK
jgi:hypothetical protein